MKLEISLVPAVLLAALLFSAGCSDSPKAGISSGAGAGQPAAELPRSGSKPEEQAPTASVTGAACNPTRVQTGAGCDQEGIQRLVKAELAPDRALAACYRNNEKGKREARIVMRIIPAPDGRTARVSVDSDSLGNAPLTGCMTDVLSGLEYPPPGDVPCTIIYPFNFVRQEAR